jgi:type IV secretion system protein VirD4
MDLDEVILVIDAQMPIRARRIKYFEDPALRVLHASQAGSFPYPDEDKLRRDRQMFETRETVEKLKLELQEVRAAAGTQGSGTANAEAATGESFKEPRTSKPMRLVRPRGRAARAAATKDRSGQMSFDPAAMGIQNTQTEVLAAAVQTTRAILAEHSNPSRR